MRPREVGLGRLVLFLYPRRYREGKGGEVLDTFRDLTASATRMTVAAEAYNLFGHAIRTRFRLTEGGTGRVLERSGPPALAAASALSAVSLVFGEWAPWQTRPAWWSKPILGHVGQFATLGPAIYVLWIAAAAAALSGQERVSRVLVTLAALATTLLAPVASFAGLARPPLYVLTTLTVLGLIALATPTRTIDWRERTVLCITSISTAAVLGSLVMGDQQSAVAGGYYRGGGDLARLALWPPAAWTLLVLASLALKSNRWKTGLTASATVGLPWLLFAYGTSGVRSPRRSAEVLVTISVVALAAWHSRQLLPRKSRRRATAN